MRHLVLSTARAQGYVGIAQRLLWTLGRENKHGGHIESSIYHCNWDCFSQFTRATKHPKTPHNKYCTNFILVYPSLGLYRLNEPHKLIRMFPLSSFIPREWNSFQPSTTDVFILQCIFFSLLVYDLYCYAGGKGKTKTMKTELTRMTFLILFIMITNSCEILWLELKKVRGTQRKWISCPRSQDG